MTDGIDHKAFRSELAALDRAERVYYTQELGSWFRAATRSEGARRQSTYAVVGIMLSMTLALVGLVADLRFVLLASQLLLAPSAWFGWASNRSARSWRRDHPFKQWLGSRA